MKIKKKLLTALIIATAVAGIISIGMFLVEGISAFTKGSMPISHIEMGGDYGEEVGIGWSIGTTYPASSPDDPVYSTSTVLINMNIIPFFLILWVVTFSISFVIMGKKKALIILAVSFVSIAVLAGIVYGVKNGIQSWLDAPKEIHRIEITTGAYNVDNVTYLWYTQKGKDVEETNAFVRKLHPAENGGYAYFTDRDLDIDSEYTSTGEQAKKLEKLRKKIKKEQDALGYSRDDREFAYYVEIVYIDNNGKYESHVMRGYNEFTESWPEFAELVNEIVGENWLLENPDFIDKDEDYLEEVFGVSEEDLPEDRTVEIFFKVQRINEINIWGGDYNGKITSMGDEIEEYREKFERETNMK